MGGAPGPRGRRADGLRGRRADGLTAEAVVCGAGIAGVAAAYHLVVRGGLRDVVLVDELPPLSLTSDKSTECYRNWWPGPGDAMVAAMNRSVDLLEELARESGDAFRMNRRGYLFATAEPTRVDAFRYAGTEAGSLGAGPLREHGPGGGDYRPASPEGWTDGLDGADLLTAPAQIQRHFPWLARDTVAVLHARRCGWLSGQQLGAWQLERARGAGARLVAGRVSAVATAGGRVSAVAVEGPGGRREIATPRFVVAAGPRLPEVARLVGVELPVFSERHAKIAFDDALGAIPRAAPLTIWTDPIRLAWPDDVRRELARSPGGARLVAELPAGVHMRPEGGADSRGVLGLWTYDTEPIEPVFPVPFEPHYTEIVLRGMARMIPALAPLLERLPRAAVDGGYYTKTRENRFLAGPLPVEGAWVIGALSGYGIMASSVAGELVAAHILGAQLPPYAPAFALARYADPAYRTLLERWGDTGQL